MKLKSSLTAGALAVCLSMAGTAFATSTATHTTVKTSSAVSTSAPAKTSSTKNLMTPVGYWEQIDESGNVNSFIQIWKTKNGTLSGKVLKGIPLPGHKPMFYCTQCSGKFKNQKIVGMHIIWGLTYNSGDNMWEGGYILDPQSGDTYHASMQMADGGKKLDVRGYIGISLFGRTQTWVRVPKDKLKATMAKYSAE